MKVSLLNKFLLKEYASYMFSIMTLYGFASCFTKVHEFVFRLVELFCKEEYFCFCIVIFIYILPFVVVFFYLWIRANMLKHIELNINNTKIVIKFGDLFAENGLKTITFNEFFDTQVDDVLISSRTLNGIFLNKQKEHIVEIEKVISDNENFNIIDEAKREQGKNVRYKLGSIKRYKDYFLVAFSKFDDKNRAYLSLSNYFACLMKYWSEVNRVYNGENVVLPLLGSGITRFDNKSIEPQFLLEAILSSFKYSNLSFSQDFCITLVLHKSLDGKINLYNIKERYYGL